MYYKSLATKKQDGKILKKIGLYDVGYVRVHGVYSIATDSSSNYLSIVSQAEKEKVLANGKNARFIIVKYQFEQFCQISWNKAKQHLAYFLEPLRTNNLRLHKLNELFQMPQKM